MVFEVFGIQLQDMEFYLLAVILFGIIASTIILLAVKMRAGHTTKNTQELAAQYEKMGDQKAKLNAQLSALEEMRNGSKITEREYISQSSRIKNQLGRIDGEMDQLLKVIALPHYDIKLQKERGLETDKMSLLVRLQEEANTHRLKIEELEGTVEDINGRNERLDSENRELKQKLDNVESSYKTRVIRLEQELDSVRKSAGIKRNPGNPGSLGNDELKRYKEKMDEYYHKIQLYQLLVSRYKGTIETNETKTVPDVKSLVQPTNSNLVPILQKIKADTKELLRQYQNAYEFLDEIQSVPYIGATLWLSIKEMLDNKVADYEDKAILLCSILRGLGASAKVVVASMADGSNRPLVLTALKDKSILLDPNKKHDFLRYVGRRNDIIKQFSVDGNTIKRVLYEFNDKDYISHEL